MKKYGLSLLAALVLAVLAFGQVEPLGIIVEPPEPDALTVRVWTDRPVYQVGDAARVHFEINKPAFIYIWDIRPDSTVARIFPNQFETQNYFQAGQHVLPTPGMVYRVAPPLGTEWLQIMAVTQPIPYEQLGGDPATLGAEVLGLIPEPAERAFDFTNFEIVAAAPPPPGTLTVRSTPSLAQVYINGVLRGWTPLTRDLTPGSYTVLVRKSGYQDETRTVTIRSGVTQSLNVALAPLVAQLPDLVVQSISHAPANPSIGQTVTFSVTIRNQGNASAGTFWVRLQGNGPADIRSISSLAAGASQTLSFSLPLTMSPETFTATADVYNQVAESNEANNTRTHTITGAPVLLASLQTNRGCGGAAMYQLGESVQVSFRVEGTGQAYVRLVNVLPTSETRTLTQQTVNRGQTVTISGEAGAPTGTRLLVLDVWESFASANRGDRPATTVECSFTVRSLMLPPGMPDMGATPGIYVWGTDKWNITVNGAPGWGMPRGYRIELRTDGSFVDVGTDAALAPLGLVPEPIDEGWRIVFEGEVGTGKITHTFRLSGASSLWMDLRLDMDGDGTPDRSIGIARLRQQKVAAPFNPVVLGVPTGHTGPFVPTVNFRIGNPFRYDRTFRIVFWGPNIGDLESP